MVIIWAIVGTVAWASAGAIGFILQYAPPLLEVPLGSPARGALLHAVIIYGVVGLFTGALVPKRPPSTSFFLMATGVIVGPLLAIFALPSEVSVAVGDIRHLVDGPLRIILGVATGLMANAILVLNGRFFG